MRGLGHRYLTAARNARQGADNGQIGSYQLARRISTDKRASSDYRIPWREAELSGVGSQIKERNRFHQFLIDKVCRSGSDECR